MTRPSACKSITAFVVLLAVVVCQGSTDNDCEIEKFSTFDTPPTMRSVFSPIKSDILLQGEISGRVDLLAFVRSDRSLCGVKVACSTDDVLLEVCREKAENAVFYAAKLNGRSADGIAELSYWIERVVYERTIHFRKGHTFKENAPFLRSVGGTTYIVDNEGTEELVRLFKGIEFVGDISIDRYRELVSILEGLFEVGESVSGVQTTFISWSSHRYTNQYNLEYLVSTSYNNGENTAITGREFRCLYDGCSYMVLPAVIRDVNP